MKREQRRKCRQILNKTYKALCSADPKQIKMACSYSKVAINWAEKNLSPHEAYIFILKMLGVFYDYRLHKLGIRKLLSTKI